MKLAIIITLSVLAGLAVLFIILNLFEKKVIKGNLTLLARVILGLLTLQFILGMTANLFVKIPDVDPWMVFHHPGAILYHTINALVLMNFALIFLIYAVKRHVVVPMAYLGFIWIVVALSCGITFVNAGQNDIFSLIMSLAFLAAFSIYGYLSTKNAEIINNK